MLQHRPLVIAAAMLAALMTVKVAGAQAHIGRPDMRADCRAEGNLTPVCGIENAEDLVLTFDGSTVIAAAYRVDASPGVLSAVSVATSNQRVLYGRGYSRGARAEWGEPGCREDAERFSGHGVSIVTRRDGRSMLAAVQHGGRESVELFEVTGRADAVALEWRGCVPAPAGVVFNDVALFRDGGFMATDYLAGNRTQLRRVYRWSAGHGYSVVPGAGGYRLNGIQLNAAQDELYLADTAADRVSRVDLRLGKVTAQIAIPAPDNLNWTREGSLLVASLGLDGSDTGACIRAFDRVCPIPYQIVEVDARLERSRVLHSGGSAFLGLGTVAVLAGDRLFIGSSMGDRILRVDLTPPARLQRPQLKPPRTRRSIQFRKPPMQ